MGDNLKKNNHSTESLQKIDPSEVPDLVTKNVDRLKDLEKLVSQAENAAELAKERAIEASNKSANRGFFTDHKKEAIESLQNAGKDMAHAVKSNSEALNLSFEFQKDLATISKGLLVLGLGNMVNNRTVVRELELRLKGASEEQLSELARNELLMVVKQLKNQQDLFKKQDSISKKVRTIKDSVELVKEEQDQLELVISDFETKHETFEYMLQAQIEADRRHDEVLLKHTQKNLEHDQLLEKQAEVDRRHDAELEKRAKKDEEHDQELSKRIITDERHDIEIKELQEQIYHLRHVPLITRIAFVLSCISFLVTIFILIKIY